MIITKDIVNKLMQLGFSSYEAKVYFALMQKHPAIGYEISKIARIPTSKIYEILTSLKNKGVIMSSSSEPTYYYPISPEILLNRLKKDFIGTIEYLEDELKQVEPIPKIDFTWNLVGYTTVLDKMINVIEAAKESLLISIWPDEAALIKKAVTEAEKRGVQVIVGIFGNIHLDLKNTINIESCGVSSLNRLGKKLTVVAGDSKEVVISEINNKEDTLGIWATTPSIILVAKEYIKHDIWGRVLIDEIGEGKFKELCENSELLSYLIENR